MFNQPFAMMSEGSTTQDKYMASGRVLLMLMFLTSLRFDSTLRVLIELVALVLLGGVMAGFHTKPAGMAFGLISLCENMYFNDFWNEHTHSHRLDFKKSLHCHRQPAALVTSRRPDTTSSSASRSLVASAWWWRSAQAV